MNAYVSLLYGNSIYFIGQLIFIVSLMNTKPKYDTVLLYTDDVPKGQIDILKKYFTKVKKIEYITLKNGVIKQERFVDIFTKLQIFALTEYDKILLMDNDMYVNRNIDHLFELDTPAAMVINPFLQFKHKEVIISKRRFNGGLMLLSPSKKTYDTMMKEIQTANEFRNLEQGYISDFYKKWINISYLYNFQFDLRTKIKNKNTKRTYVYNKTKIDQVYVIHYSSSRSKPWLLFRANFEYKIPENFLKWYAPWIIEYVKIMKEYLKKGINIDELYS